jgi:GNAT superfamily N-acetyltransferase
MKAREFITEYKITREDFEGMTIEMVKNGHVLVINALDDWGNNILGSVAFNIGDDNDLDPQDLKVDERYQGQGIARIMYDYAKSKGYEIHRSYDQTDAGRGFWNKHRGEDVRVWESDLNEISDERLQHYLSRADRQVSNRMNRMAQARERLNKGYEIYHADRPAGGSQIVDRFDADTPAQAQRYYERFIRDYVSDVDFDLRLRRSTGIMEISRLPKREMGDWGNKGTLTDPTHPIETKPLPGGSRFSYAINKPEAEHIEIMIFDGQTLAAEMDLFYTQDYMKTWRVDTVVVEPEYRGQGLGKALYGIALSILKLTLEAGETQTHHGQQMWLMLNSIPGVKVVGYNMTPTDEYRPHSGDHVVDQNERWTRYTFPVKPGKRSMRSGRRGTGLYTTQASMIAKWTGQ